MKRSSEQVLHQFAVKICLHNYLHFFFFAFLVFHTAKWVNNHNYKTISLLFGFR